MGYECFKIGVQILFSDLDVGACIFYENVPIGTWHLSFQSTQNKHQYGTKITCTEVRGKNIVTNFCGSDL